MYIFSYISYIFHIFFSYIFFPHLFSILEEKKLYTKGKKYKSIIFSKHISLFIFVKRVQKDSDPFRKIHAYLTH